ncbi:hypothetical protein [Alicyclobacillus sp. SO9]|uniref:hypothetical protein n=1 Tax=Alicyclobacillus sp. SO9 TaxID=2665646 RepID=UPI0018E8728A|nr:hypothetical protein [Alicyclobacillus sp. SO9]QQE80579.1 hypothetical protein GI364_09310 [Alicyclobacillus sp. SO9]
MSSNVKTAVDWKLGRLSVARLRRARVRQAFPIVYPNIAKGQSVFTRSFTASGFVVLDVQLPAGPTRTIPTVTYQVVNAVTLAPLSPAITRKGTRFVVLPFFSNDGLRHTVKLKMKNNGTGSVALYGALLAN